MIENQENNSNISWQDIDRIRLVMPARLKEFIFEQSHSFYHLGEIARLYASFLHLLNSEDAEMKTIEELQRINEQSTVDYYGISHPECSEEVREFHKYQETVKDHAHIWDKYTS